MSNFAKRCANGSLPVNATQQVPLTNCERDSIYALSAPGLDPQVNGVRGLRVSSLGDLYVQGDAIIKGRIRANGGGGGGGMVGLDDGANTAPSLYFLNETQLGLYRPSAGTLAWTNGLDPIATATIDSFAVNHELSTAGGNDLSINPGGPNVDFNGKNLINVGAVLTSPNYFQVVSAVPVSTPDATPTPVLDINTITDAAYTAQCTITGISLVDNSSTASISIVASFKNIGGTVTVAAPKVVSVIADPALLGVYANITSTGATAHLAVIGLGGITIKWSGGGWITRVPLA